MRVFIIAEAACTWRIRDDRQHIRYARKAIIAAKAAGADAVKFQWVSDPQQMAQRRNVLREAYTILAWPEAWLPIIARECTRLDIEFICSVFLPSDIATIAPYVKRFKIASLEYLDRAMWDAAHAQQKQIIASTGCTTAEEARSVLLWNFQEQDKRLMCTSSYPCPLDQVNLRAIREFDGFSDHTADTLTGAVAVAAGARILEVHFRLDETMKYNPDYNHSLSVNGLIEYVTNVRKTEVMMGSGVKRAEAGERQLLDNRVFTSEQ
jgi:sialic acid synthase SpsE